MGAETKWTPGRWDWAPPPGTDREDGARVFVVAGGTSRDLALVGGDRFADASANARLMAAAPELYEALLGALDHLAHSGGCDWIHESGDGCRCGSANAAAAIRAALAKAEGSR